jgi:hypothetical protein
MRAVERALQRELFQARPISASIWRRSHRLQLLEVFLRF